MANGSHPERSEAIGELIRAMAVASSKFKDRLDGRGRPAEERRQLFIAAAEEFEEIAIRLRKDAEMAEEPPHPRHTGTAAEVAEARRGLSKNAS